MKRNLLALLLMLTGHWSAPSFADDYPTNHLKVQLGQVYVPVEVDLAGMQPGDSRTANYLERPIWIYRRTGADIEYLRAGQKEHLANPEGSDLYAVFQDQYLTAKDEIWVRVLTASQPKFESRKFRSITEEYLVVVRSGPLGCTLQRQPMELRPQPSVLFLDVCNGTWFDVAGRVLKSHWRTPRLRAQELAGANLFIPPHHFSSPSRLVIGMSLSDALPAVDFVAIRSRVYARLSPIERLAYAAGYNDIEEVRRGLAAGAHTQSGATVLNPINPLHSAIVGGSMDIIELLLAHGVRPGSNAIEIAELVERKDVIELLTSYVQNAKPQDTCSGCI